jgi:NADH-quinone oxidoreductase subunit H
VPADSFLPALLVPPFQVLVILVKASVLMFVTMWLRWTLPRVRIDQLMFVCWKVLIPLGLINVIGTALWMCFWPVGLWD